MGLTFAIESPPPYFIIIIITTTTTATIMIHTSTLTYNGARTQKE